MNLSELMSKEVVTAKMDDSLNTASKIIKEKKVRHLPVLDGKGKLVGIVTDRDLKRASASDATLLEVHELLYLLSKVKLADVMTKKVVTATPETPVNAGADLLVSNKIGCLPVMTNGDLVGIVTETDFLKYLAKA